MCAESVAWVPDEIQKFGLHSQRFISGRFRRASRKKTPWEKISIVQFTSHFRHRQKYSDTKTSVRSLFTRSVRYMTIHADRVIFVYRPLVLQ